MEPAGPPLASAGVLPADYNYELFLLDAATGGRALGYLQSHAEPCGGAGRVAPQVEVPREQVSIPWTLGTRNPDGHSATITAEVLPCDGYLPTVNVDRDQPSAAVFVERPVGADVAACGAARSATLTLHAATVTASLPATIGHDPTGLFAGVTSPGPSTTPPPSGPSPTTPPRMLLPSDGESTITVTAARSS